MTEPDKAPNSGDKTGDQQQEAGGVDLEALARAIVEKLKEDLRIENERQGRPL